MYPIPYQGSKRKLAPKIFPLLPPQIDVFYEPFAGSAAMSIFVANANSAKKIVISDICTPLVELLKNMVFVPDEVCKKYEQIWQIGANSSCDFYYEIRSRYNRYNDPVDLLYLICRCVKNAVRFNSKGNFTQSVDKRRKGMSPKKMEKSIREVSFLLKGKVEFRVGDWLNTTADASKNSFVYMDPPYSGTSIGRDRRYHSQLTQEELITGLQSFQERGVSFALSYDGKTGDKVYGPPLPESLNLTHLLLNAGRSSQATLNGLDAITYESLYISGYDIPAATPKIIEKALPSPQLSLLAASFI